MRPESALPPGDVSRLTIGAASRVLLVASLVMVALLIYVGRWLTFWSDEWTWIFSRPDPTVKSLLGGSDVHLHLFPVLIYQALFRLAGLTSYFPYLTVLWVFDLACVWLLFAVTGRLAGWGFGLVAGLSLLFLGSGFEVLFQPGQMGYTLSEATGLLALLLLMRARDAGRPGLCRVGAGAALCIGVASSGVGMLFVGLIVVWAGLRRDWRSLGAALPAFAFYAVWFPLYAERTTARIEPTLAGLLHVPASIGFGVGATVTAVLGLPPYRFAVAGLVIAVVGIGVLWRLGVRFDALALAALAALVAEFVLVAGFRPSFGISWAARSGYLHPAVAFLWLFAASVWAGERFRLRSWLRPWMVATALVLAVLGSMVQFTGAARGMRILRANEIAYLRLLEALRDSEDLKRGAVSLKRSAEGMYGIPPWQYLAAIDRFGAPRLAYPEPTLSDLGFADPGLLDQALLRVVARGIRPAPIGSVDGPPPQVAVTGGSADPAGQSCVLVAAGPTPATATWAPGRVFSVEGRTPGAVLAVRLGVFAPPDKAIVPAPGNPAGAATAIQLPALPAGLRWRVQVDVAAGEAVTLCGGAASTAS